MPDKMPAKNAPLLLALRLANDVMNASDGDLEGAVTLCERTSVFFGGVIFVGIAFEIVLAWYQFPSVTRLGHWGPVWADVLVAAGVGLEVAFGFRGSGLQSELTRRTNTLLAMAVKVAGEANERAAEAELETARLRAHAVLVSDALLETAKAVRSHAVVTGLNRTTMELQALRHGWATPEMVSEATRIFGVIPKVKSFVGTRFDALTTSNSIELEVFTRELRSALKAAYWIAIDRSDAGIPKTADAGDALVIIHVDAGKVPELWEAAEALASALKAEGIEAIAESVPTPEKSDANAIHILGPRLIKSTTR